MRKSNKLIEGSRALDLFEHAEAELAPAPPRAFEAGPGEAEAAHLRRFLSYVRRRLWLVAGVTALCTALVAVYMARQPDLYEARAQVQVDLETLNASVGTSKNGSFFVNPVNDPAYFNTQLQILTGPRLLRRVVKSLELERDPSFRVSREPASVPLWQKISNATGLTSSAADAPINLSAAGESAAEGSPTSSEDLAEAARLAPYVETIQANLKV
ncbi:MAG TPA: Wzz/FepE/Etk N-terminal domain-containing protein, partial [Pyrinomonadaceae bacterium]|nr:Wzz/FepE/Etk N-terminal domain-containing protein [Pyrinomonadaceae bacterium]